MPLLDLSDDEAQALVRLLQDTVGNARFFYAPRLAPLKAILAKLMPPVPPAAPRPPLPPGAAPSRGRSHRR